MVRGQLNNVEDLTPSEVISEIVKRYCEYTESFDDLKAWVFSCLKDSIENKELITKESLGYKGVKINFVDDYMFFSLSLEMDCTHSDSSNFIEVAIWVSSYLNEIYGSTVLESLVKELVFSDTDLAELSEVMALEMDKWCENVTMLTANN